MKKAIRPAIFKWRQTEPELILCAGRGEVYGGRRLPYPTLEAGNGDDHCLRLYQKSECLNI